ncbi:hypothetical protein DEH81_06025 [Pectobacterium zantedeschiae]|nr:hypothetical protein DEH81_06025 [Pectobacterium zantedeschiae]
MMALLLNVLSLHCDWLIKIVIRSQFLFSITYRLTEVSKVECDNKVEAITKIVCKRNERTLNLESYT